MENENKLKEEIGEVVRGVIREEIKLLKSGFDGKFDEINTKFDGIDIKFKGMDAQFNTIDARFDGIDRRFDKVDLSIRQLGISIEELDSKFSTITDGQDIIRDVLETRVAHIEEILGVEAKV